MADVKVTLGGDAKPLLSAIKEAENELKKLKQAAREAAQAASSGTGGGMFASTAKKWLGRLGLAGMAMNMINAASAVAGELRDMVRDRLASERAGARSRAGASAAELQGQAGTAGDTLFQKRQELQRERDKRSIGGWLTDPMEALKSFRRADQIKEDIKLARAEQQKAISESVSAGRQEIQISALRAAGKDSEADAAQRVLEMEREILKLNASGVSIQEGPGKERLEQIKKQKQIGDISASIAQQQAMSVTQIASSKAQLGLGGGGVMFGRNPDDAVLKQQLQVLDQILAVAQNVRGNTNNPTFSASTERGPNRP